MTNYINRACNRYCSKSAAHYSKSNGRKISANEQMEKICTEIGNAAQRLDMQPANSDQYLRMMT